MTSLLPPEFNTVTLTGAYVNLDGTPTVGYLMFKPSPVILKAAVSKDLIIPTVIQVNLTTDGSFSVTLPATDDPDIAPSNWTYEVTEAFGTRRVYSIGVHLSNGTAQNIYDLAPVSLSNGTFYDQGPTGPAGPPALIVSGVPAAGLGGTGDYAIDPVAGIIYGPKGQTTGWPAGVHLSATDIAAHAALTNTHGIGVGSVLVGTTDAQTLTNKHLTAPVVTGGLTTDGVTNSGSSSVTGSQTVGGTLAVTGTVSGGVATFPSVTINNAPSAISDAVRKDYADALGTSSSGAGTIVRRDTAGNYFGVAAVYLDLTPNVASMATRKDYVDSQDAAFRRFNATTLTTAYSLALGDEHTLLRMNSATPVSVTVPPNGAVAFPVGAVIELSQSGAGQLTLVPGSGVTLNAPDGALSTRAQHSRIRLIKSATDTWSVFGDMNGTIAQIAAGATSLATPGALAIRDSNGRMRVNEPAVAADIATKNYVDTTTVSTAAATVALTGNLTVAGLFSANGGMNTLPLLQQSADPAAPTGAGTAVAWKANDKGVYILSQDAAKRRIKTHWSASGTAFQAAALTGDTFLRTDLGTNGSLWQYAGGSIGLSGWLPESDIVCTSTTRPASANCFAGMRIYETDTGRTYSWTLANTFATGQAALWDQVAGPPETYALINWVAGFQSIVAGAYRALVVAKRGRDCWFEGQLTRTGTTALAANTTYGFATVPTLCQANGGTQAPVTFYTGTGTTFASAVAIVQTDGTAYVNPTIASSAAWSFDVSSVRWRTNN